MGDPQPEDRLTCVGCGYDLHGSKGSVRCPECGLHTAISESRRQRRAYRFRGLPWRTMVLIAGLCVVLAMLLAGYVRAWETWVCLDCGLIEQRRVHELWIPGTGARVLRFLGGAERPKYCSTLPHLLDPEGTCRHRWALSSRSTKTIAREFRGGPNFATAGAAMDEEYFDEFVSSNPWVVRALPAKIRASLAKGAPEVRDFLEAEYCKWLMQTKGLECYYNSP